MKNEKLLREYVRSILAEDISPGGADAFYGYDPQPRDAWGAVSFGSSDDFLGAFGVKGIVNLGKATLGATEEITRRGLTMLPVAFGVIASIILPWVNVSYSEIFEKENQDIQKIRAKYKAVNEEIDKVFGDVDVKALAFMASPGALLGVQSAIIAPEVATKLFSAVTGGYSDKLLASIFDGKISNFLLGSDQKEPAKTKSTRRKNESTLHEAEEDESQRNKKTKTLRAVLSNPAFVSKAISNKNSVVDEMSSEAQTIVLQTLKDAEQEAAAALQHDNTLESFISSMKKYSKKQPPRELLDQIDEIEKLPRDKKSLAEKKMLDQLKKALKDLFINPLKERIKLVKTIDPSSQSFFVKEHLKTIDKIQSL